MVLAIMVGILKALHSDESTENNTKAFSVLIAFSGGVWRKLIIPPDLRAMLLPFASPNQNGLSQNPNLEDIHIHVLSHYSTLCPSLVLLREKKTRVICPRRDVIVNDRVQTDICCIPGMFEVETDIFVSDILLLDVRLSPHIPFYGTEYGHILSRGDVLNTTV